MAELRIGMVGLDTSHCEAFCEVLHDESNPNHVSGARVVRAFPGGSEAFSKSIERVDGFTRTLRDRFGVEIVDDIRSVGSGADAFFLTSVDGRQHLDQFRALAEFGKPVFIDKPLACSSADAREIAAIADRKGAPVMTASAIRYARGVAGLCAPDADVRSCDAFGPAAILEDYPGYFWYGIHSADVLFSYMGAGCRSVRAEYVDGMDLLVGTWDDGRIATLRGTRFEGGTFGCTVFTTDGVRHGLLEAEPPFHVMLLRQVVPFLAGGKSPVPLAESVEVIAFLEGAWKSRTRGGESVSLTA